MVRIRYTSNDSGTELLSKGIESTHGVLRSRIYRDQSLWVSTIQKLSDSEDGSELWSEVENTSSTTVNLAVAKSKAKRSLKALGVRFLDEVRRRGSTNGV